jgi:hypothetical protein
MRGNHADALERIEEAHRIQRESPATEDRYNTAARAASIAHLAMRLGRRESARHALVEALEFYRDAGARGGNLATVVLGAADYLESGGMLETAALLFGVDEGLSASHLSETRWYALIGKRREEMLAHFRDGLGGPHLLSLLERGRAMAPEDAVRLALESIRSSTP